MRRIWYGTRAFSFRGEQYRYFVDPYNTTWNNERAVEVPIIWQAVAGSAKGRVLEVGNVLAHYYVAQHDVLDKYEPAVGVINEDVVSFKPAHPYDLIVSISTIEHVGWDELPREAGKYLVAIQRLCEMLAPEGQLIMTFPVGYNADLDRAVASGTLPIRDAGYLLRISRRRWREATIDEIAGARYDAPYPRANAIVVAYFSRQL